MQRSASRRTPDGQLFVFCSVCCLLEYAIYGLPADLEPTLHEAGESEAAA